MSLSEGSHVLVGFYVSVLLSFQVTQKALPEPALEAGKGSLL